MHVNSSALGKKSIYTDQYNPSLLFAIPRVDKRNEIGIDNNNMTFYGYDIWNAYEISWLRPDRRPDIATSEIIYSCRSEYIIESKSLKLYLNSFNGTIFKSKDHVKTTIEQDLSHKLSTDVIVKLEDINTEVTLKNPEGKNIDNYYDKKLDNCKIEITDKTIVQDEKIYTHLLKSNCPVTMQPDWGTLIINYSGAKINYSSLINYIISLRNLNEFHEQCIEKIYMDIYRNCKTSNLEVYGRYTRRGGIDINPYRSTKDTPIPENIRTYRQ
ncbi:NADPH-dependent 7-cyano-7-deazaguanine reductase QueF [Candidatus Aquarickettsia rohweri]|uniref:NADPH-dependent 7-cyano-7-deazaguanine reductase QueF n=1 Tax=Candidatus Aquarickettsia rohweri TaxID=2602574 RepID=A0A429XUU5_9RICK|nr:NADPH-dependent 7-cyano-7-deazaguanine reductase QueF [Candidatus Aquarickettsia rohweri]RST71957.1 NADPH-dependent 7-cyano-7-deazaguanine reductase QueF [Candidatus Aquarickettsia rohweri]